MFLQPSKRSHFEYSVPSFAFHNDFYIGWKLIP
jgi:hypothetical protein